MTPRLDAGLGPPARLFAQAYRRALALYEAHPEAILARGALQVGGPGPRRRPLRQGCRAGGLLEPGGLARLTPDQAADALGEPAPEALALTQALVIDPKRALAPWAGAVVKAEVARIEAAGAGWRLLDSAGGQVCEADAVIVAAGLASAGLVEGLPLSAVRGQASWTAAVDAPRPPAAAFGGYVLPMGEGLLFGATHDRGDTARDLRPADHARNLQSLAEGLPQLAARLAGQPLEGRASIRVATPDFLPVAGAAPGAAEGLFVLSGFGARGFTMAPLLAEHVAALAIGAPVAAARAAGRDRRAGPVPGARCPSPFMKPSASLCVPDLSGHALPRKRTRAMNRTITLAAAAVLALSAAGAAAAADKPAAPPAKANQCFWTRFADGFAAPDEHTLYVRVPRQGRLRVRDVRALHRPRLGPAHRARLPVRLADLHRHGRRHRHARDRHRPPALRGPKRQEADPRRDRRPPQARPGLRANQSPPPQRGEAAIIATKNTKRREGGRRRSDTSSLDPFVPVRVFRG